MIPAQLASRIYIEKKVPDFQYGHKFENKSQVNRSYEKITILFWIHIWFFREKKLQPSKKTKSS